MGGRSNAPPPSRRWKIQRPSRARVNRAGLCNLSLVILGRHRPIRTQEHQVIFTKVYKVQSIYLPTHAIINYINEEPTPLAFFHHLFFVCFGQEVSVISLLDATVCL